MLLDTALTPAERYWPVLAIVSLAVLAGLLAWIVLRSLRRPR